MTLNKAMQNMKYDVRMIEFNLSNNQMTNDELKTHLQGLPDCAANSAPITLEDIDDADPTEQH